MNKPGGMPAPWHWALLRGASRYRYPRSGTTDGMAHTNKLLAGWSNTQPVGTRITRDGPDTARMPPQRKLVAVIDDDHSVRTALDRQISAAGYRSHVFASAEDFLKVAALCGAACIVCDIHLFDQRAGSFIARTMPKNVFLLRSRLPVMHLNEK